MRRLFFALLFVNIAYGGWALWVTPPPKVPPNEAFARLPPLKLVSELPADQRPDPDALPTRLPDAVTVSCMSLGPFPDVNNSAQAAALLKQKGFDPKQRAAQADTIQGFGVFVTGMKTEAETDKVLVTLEHNGVKDALLMPATADSGRRVSLGLFSERVRAERRAGVGAQHGTQGRGHGAQDPRDALLGGPGTAARSEQRPVAGPVRGRRELEGHRATLPHDRRHPRGHRIPRRGRSGNQHRECPGRGSPEVTLSGRPTAMGETRPGQGLPCTKREPQVWHRCGRR